MNIITFYVLTDLTIFETNVLVDEVRTEFNISVMLNSRLFRRVIIDPHYKDNHPEMSDELVLELVAELHNKEIDLDDSKNGFDYFVAFPVVLSGKPYKIIFLTREDDDFIGVVNAFRIDGSSV